MIDTPTSDVSSDLKWVEVRYGRNHKVVHPTLVPQHHLVPVHGVPY